MEKLAAEQQAREAAQQQQQQQQQQQGGAVGPGDPMVTGQSQGDPGDSVPPTSPQTSLDQGSLQHTMDKNKESEWHPHACTVCMTYCWCRPRTVHSCYQSPV